MLLEVIPFSTRCLTDIQTLLTKKAKWFAQCELAYMLHSAAATGRLEVCQTLLDIRADPNAVDSVGAGPLRRASLYGHPQVAELLINRAADVNHVTPLRSTCLMVASACGQLEVVEVLLVHKATLENCTSHSETALIQAAVGSRFLVVSRLIKAGANLTCCDEWGRSAADLAPVAMQLAQSHLLLTTCETGLPSVLLGLVCEYHFDEGEFLKDLNAKCNSELILVTNQSMGFFIAEPDTSMTG